MKRITNAQKILKALESGSTTQADLAKKTKVKNTYQIVTDLVKKGLVSKVNGIVILNKSKLPIAIDKTDKVTAKDVQATLPKPEPEIIKTLRDEVENIQDGIRSLMITRTYLLRRIEEEKRNA